MSRAITLLAVYLLIAPGVAGLAYLGGHWLNGSFPAHANEVMRAFYLFGSVVGLAAGVLHFLARNWSAIAGFGCVVALGTLAAAAYGPQAMGAGFVALVVCFPIARRLSAQT